MLHSMQSLHLSVNEAQHVLQAGLRGGWGGEWNQACYSPLCSKCLFSHPHSNSFLFVALSFGRCPHLIYFLEHVSGFSGKLRQCTLSFGGGFTFYSSRHPHSSCPGCTQVCCLALGDGFGHLPEFPFGPLEKLQIFVLHNKRSPALSYPLSPTFHYRVIQPAFDWRVFSEKVRHLFFLHLKTHRNAGQVFSQETAILSLQISVAQLCLLCGRPFQTLTSTGVSLTFFRCGGR